MSAITIVNIMCNKCACVEQDGEQGTEMCITTAREAAAERGWIYTVDTDEPPVTGTRRSRIDICPACQIYAGLSDADRTKW